MEGLGSSVVQKRYGARLHTGYTQSSTVFGDTAVPALAMERNPRDHVMADLTTPYCARHYSALNFTHLKISSRIYRA